MDLMPDFAGAAGAAAAVEEWSLAVSRVNSLQKKGLLYSVANSSSILVAPNELQKAKRLNRG